VMTRAGFGSSLLRITQFKKDDGCQASFQVFTVFTFNFCSSVMLCRGPGLTDPDVSKTLLSFQTLGFVNPSA
jgi:hypothetical protein